MFGFPLLLIPLAICNIIVFLMPGVSFAAPLFTLPLMSGAGWTVTLSDALVAFGLFLLLLEVLKSARVGGKYVTDHLLALVIFGGAAAEFVMLPQFANATFFLLTLIALVDFLSGLGLRSRRPRRIRDTVVVEPVRESAEVLAQKPVGHPVIVMREPSAAVAPVPAAVGREPEPYAAPLHVEEIYPDRAVANAQPARVEPIIDMGPPGEHSDKPRPPAA